MTRTQLEKVAEAAIWLERERNTMKAGRMRLAKSIRLAHRDGASISEIARAARVSRPTVYSILRSA
jgi:DNA invertase Pin-like site-specific DNA recombinase